MIRNSSVSYGSVAKSFHWVIFILVTFMLVLGYCMDDVTDKMVRAEIVNIHKLTGLSILLLMTLRLLWALMNPKPDLPSGTKLWERHLERAVHFLLYFVLFAMPIAGWIMSVAGGHAPHLFNLSLSLPLPQNTMVKHIAADMHDTLAIVIIILVSLHVLAALYHYFFKKDEVLSRMMPGN